MHNPEFAPFPRDEYVARFNRARELMKEFKIDVLVLTGKENVVYYTGLQTIGWDSKHRPLGAILARDSDLASLVIPETLMGVARETSWADDVVPWGGVRVPGAAADPIIGIHKTLERRKLTRATIGMELGYGQRLAMSQTDYAALLKLVPDATIVDASEMLWKQRMIKSPREIEALRAASTATSNAFAETFAAMREGMTETEIAGRMFQALAKSNYRPGFVMIRSGRRKYDMVNVCPFDKPVERGDLVVVDAGATYKDYWADFMRMASIGEPSTEQRAFFEADLASQKAGVAVIKPGIKAAEIFDACNSILQERGFGQHARIERVGHGLGLDVHEPPSLARGAQTIIEEGMVLTVEPIFSDLPNYQIGNFALEDVVVVTKTGHEIVSTFPKDLHIV
jgi:Xaa-Pro aminopeptidase